MFKDYHEYNDILKKINYCLNWYDNKQIYDSSYKLYLANDKSYEIKFPESSIAHLLGINIDYLRSSGHYSGGSYQILNDMLNNPTRLYNLIKDGFLKKDKVFSKYIDKKLNSFRDNCKIIIKNIEFIVEYKSKNSYITGEEKLEGDYYIGFKNDEKNPNCLTIIGFTKNGKYLYPLTNLSVDLSIEEEEQFLNRLLKNQTITSLQSLIIYNYDGYERVKTGPIHYNHDDKLQKLKVLSDYASKYEANVATNKETLFYIEKTMNLFDEKNNIWNILDDITNSIMNKEIINIEDLEEKYGYVKRSIFNTISAYNDFIISGNNDTSFSYQEFATELKEEKERALKYESLYTKANEKNIELMEKLKLLEDENKVLKENEEKIRKIVNR